MNHPYFFSNLYCLYFHCIYIFIAFKVCPEYYPFVVWRKMDIGLQMVIVILHIYQFGGFQFVPVDIE